MITSKQRSFLRKLANTIDPIFQVGKGGINDEFIKQIDMALEARELIKINVLNNAELSAKEACHKLSDAVNAEEVQVIGNKFVLYRPSKEKPKIELPKS